MCGIVGVLGAGPAAPTLLEGLRRLEYRGYDSAGIATLDNGLLTRRRAPGKLAALEAALAAEPLGGAAGIGHTRWATHGAATEANAHPHAAGRVAVVHNGIVENYAEIRAELAAAGRVFESETDTEVVAQLVDWLMETGNLGPEAAVDAALARLEGAFALAFLFAGEPDLMIVARAGSPLAVGLADGAVYVGSDAHALAPFTRRIVYLEEGDRATLTRTSLAVVDRDGAPAVRAETVSQAVDAFADKDGHRHFMAKEIHEQPTATAHTLSRYLDAPNARARLPEGADFDFADAERLTISACGTAYIAGLVARYWFETYARLPVDVEIASELRYRDPVWPRRGGALFVSQSGETADTLAAMRAARAAGQRTAALVNVPESSLAREADAVFPTAAGPEIGVASTKAFTAQLAALASLAIAAGRARGVLDADAEADLVADLMSAPRRIAAALEAAPQVEALAREIAHARDVLFIGRGPALPLALEGALKLKEISYIHAEGLAAGELKHGPIALIDDKTPVVVIAPPDPRMEKTLSNMQEAMARGARVVLISDAAGIARAEAGGGRLWAKIVAPDCGAIAAPLVYSVPLQLLAYYTAAAKGTDVDQPRNLAKSVTVE